MPLTPEDVSNKRFTPVRFREGYDMGEVDHFLDEVEAELARLTRENKDLRSQTSGAQQGERSPAPTPAPDKSRASDEPVVAAAATTPTAPAEKVATAPATPTAPAETIKVHTVADASTAAVRLLEIATRNADELVTDAKNEAEQLLGHARNNAQELESESKQRAEKLEADARSRAEMVNSEVTERRQQLLDDVEQERQQLSLEVDSLRSFEREYRSRLRTYFEQQLAFLDEGGEEAALDAQNARSDLEQEHRQPAGSASQGGDDRAQPSRPHSQRGDDEAQDTTGYGS